MTPERVRVQALERLTKGQLCDVVALAEAATLADAVSPLSEQALLNARNALPSTRSATTLV
ncbi:MAG: hypothetical protein QOF35_271, partial [Actinomycetota bacterium]|nr:hypothetical protein [Actinomycetota bacterium]